MIDYKRLAQLVSGRITTDAKRVVMTSAITYWGDIVVSVAHLSIKRKDGEKRRKTNFAREI